MKIKILTVVGMAVFLSACGRGSGDTNGSLGLSHTDPVSTSTVPHQFSPASPASSSSTK
jgi:hypothetical protein